MKKEKSTKSPRKLFKDYYRAEREQITTMRICRADYNNLDAEQEGIKREAIVDHTESKFTDAMKEAVSGFNGGRYTNAHQIEMSSFRDEKISLFAKKLSERHGDVEPAKTIISNVQESLKTRAWNPWVLSLIDYKNAEAAKRNKQ